MQFAFILPEKHLELACVSRTHMVLTPYYLLSKTYRDFYRARSAEGHFVILDNGFHEYDRQRSDGWDVIDAIVPHLKPTVAVMPETPDWNTDLLLENLEHISEYSSTTEWLYVIRSLDLLEAQEELHFLSENDPDRLVKWVGIHKDIEMIVKGNIGGR